MEEDIAKMGKGGMPREQWEHGDKSAEDESGRRYAGARRERKIDRYRYT